MPDSGSQIRGIEGLRAVAAVTLLIYHVWLYGSPLGEKADFGVINTALNNLQAGVVLFFALSGFLLYRPYAKAIMARDHLPRTGAYLVRRGLRIFPAYWVTLIVVSLILDIARLDIRTMETGSFADRPGLLVANVVMAQNYHPATILTGIGPSWSLSVELAFYLLLPLVANLGVALAGRWPTDIDRARTIWIAPVIFMTLGLLGKGLAGSLQALALTTGSVWGGTWYSVLALSILYHGDLFAYGMAVAALSVRGQTATPGVGRLPVREIAITASFVGALAVGLFLLGVFQPRQVADVLTGLIAALIVGVVVLEECRSRSVRLMRRALDAKPVAATGLVSYGIFLWNEPLTLWLAQSGWTAPGRLGLLSNVALVLPIVLLVSTASYWLIERPAVRIASASKRQKEERSRWR